MRSRPRALALGIAVVAIAVAFFAIAPQRTPGPPLRDFEAYYAAGATWRYHGDAYGRDVWRVERSVPGVVATRDELLPFVGPPYALPLWELFARLPWGAATVAWALVLLGAFVTIALACLRLAGGPFDWPAVCAALVFCLTFAPLTSGVALGQVAIVSCAAIFMFPALLRPRMLVAATACALGAALQPNLAVVLVARLTGMRAWLALGCAALIALFGSLLALGEPASGLRYVAVLQAHAAAERFIAIQTTTAATMRGFGAAPAVATGAAAACALATLAIFALHIRRGRYAADARLVLACAAWPLALPFAHEHDFTLALLPAVVAVRRARGARWTLAAVSTLLLAVDWLGLAQHPAGVAQSALLAFAAALALAALPSERFTWRRVAALLLVVPAVAAAGAVSGHHMLPTWPDALPAQFAAPLAATAAEVWRAEQERSGIGALDPWWSVLRLAPLTGCALLWFVAAQVLHEPVTATPTARRSAASSTAHRPPAAVYPSA